jgi:hypothetical protein
MIEARRLAQNALSHHYMIQKRVTKDREKARRQTLFTTELSRIGIECALVDEYQQIEDAFFEIARKSRGSTLFVTGSHSRTSPKAAKFGKALADLQMVCLLDGQSTGVSRDLINAYSQTCLEKKYDIRNRLRLFPNPYAINPAFENDLSLLPELQVWRAPLMRAAQIAIIFSGSKGTEAEIAVARKNKCILLPVPEKANDQASNLLRDKDVSESLTKLAPDYLSKALANNISPTDFVKAVQGILSR